MHEPKVIFESSIINNTDSGYVLQNYILDPHEKTYVKFYHEDHIDFALELQKNGIITFKIQPNVDSNGKFSNYDVPTVSADDLVDGVNNKVFTNYHKNKLDNLADSFEFTQLTPSTPWQISHTLNKFPNVVITDNNGNLVLADVRYINKELVEITFSEPFFGNAYLD